MVFLKDLENGNALYGDLQAAKRYLKKYYELGGTYKGLRQSINMAHPIAGIRKQDR